MLEAYKCLQFPHWHLSIYLGFDKEAAKSSTLKVRFLESVCAWLGFYGFSRHHLRISV